MLAFASVAQAAANGGPGTAPISAFVRQWLSDIAPALAEAPHNPVGAPLNPAYGAPCLARPSSLPLPRRTPPPQPPLQLRRTTNTSGDAPARPSGDSAFHSGAAAQQPHLQGHASVPAHALSLSPAAMPPPPTGVAPQPPHWWRKRASSPAPVSQPSSLSSSSCTPMPASSVTSIARSREASDSSGSGSVQGARVGAPTAGGAEPASYALGTLSAELGEALASEDSMMAHVAALTRNRSRSRVLAALHAAGLPVLDAQQLKRPSSLDGVSPPGTHGDSEGTSADALSSSFEGSPECSDDGASEAAAGGRGSPTGLYQPMRALMEDVEDTSGGVARPADPEVWPHVVADVSLGRKAGFADAAGAAHCSCMRSCMSL
jgi:hypothetical protein